MSFPYNLTVVCLFVFNQAKIFNVKVFVQINSIYCLLCIITLIDFFSNLFLQFGVVYKYQGYTYAP